MVKVGTYTKEPKVASQRQVFTLCRLMLYLCSSSCFAVTAAAPNTATSQPLRVVYGSPIGAGPTTEMYPYKILKAALDATEQPYRLSPASTDMVQSRVLREIELGNVDVYWSATSKQREQSLLPIRIPLDKGLNGWRLLLIRKTDIARFAALQSPAAIKSLRMAQGHDWPDTSLLLHNGFSVQTAQHPPALFELLLRQRVDAFPRSVIEAFREQQQYPELTVEPHWVLVYPAAVYFFVNRHNTALAARLELGLARIKASGEFDRLFEQRYGESIKAAKLAERQVIRLENPSISLDVDDASLWYQVPLP